MRHIWSNHSRAELSPTFSMYYDLKIKKRLGSTQHGNDLTICASLNVTSIKIFNMILKQSIKIKIEVYLPFSSNTTYEHTYGSSVSSVIEFETKIDIQKTEKVGQRKIFLCSYIGSSLPIAQGL